MTSRKPRLEKKLHTRYQADFLFECSQDPVWAEKLKNLEDGQALESAMDGLPQDFVALFPETEEMLLNYCIERVELADVPRPASCWWPIAEGTQFLFCYPAPFPQAARYFAVHIDDHDHTPDP